MTHQLSGEERRLCEWLCRPESESPPDSISAEFVRRNKLDAVVAERHPAGEQFADDRLRSTSFEEVAELCEALDERDSDHAVIKSLPVVPKPVGDVDVLVRDIDAATAILEEQSYEISSRERYKRVLEKQAGDLRVAIHLHEEIAWEGVRYLDVDSVLTDCRTRETAFGTFPVPAPEDELLITAAHMFFEHGNGRVVFLNVLEYAAHFTNGDPDLESMLTHADRRGWRVSLERFLGSVNAIQRDICGTPVSPSFDELDVGGFASYEPLFKSWLFSVGVLMRDRVSRLHRNAASDEWDELPNLFCTYVGDVADILAERYGVTYTKKRLKLWLTTTFMAL